VNLKIQGPHCNLANQLGRPSHGTVDHRRGRFYHCQRAPSPHRANTRRYPSRAALVRAGDKVELRPPAEILATLDDKGCLDGVPFMPEMLGFFGRPFTVEAQVERACDTVRYSGVRRLRDTVILDDLRCNGSGHAGCQAQCRLYWKEAWLRPASTDERQDGVPGSDDFMQLQQITLANVHGADSKPDDVRYRCQATELLRASEPVGWWSARSFLGELTNGNVGVWRFLSVMARIIVEEIGRRVGIVSSHPFRSNEMNGQKAIQPASGGLRPGDLVQIRTKSEIGQTLDANGKSKGLWFDREMLPYCSQRARVKAKVERIIDEGSGRLIEIKSDCYILDDVVCRSDRSEGRWFCPRAIYPYWRECWLRPLSPEAAESQSNASRS